MRKISGRDRSVCVGDMAMTSTNSTSFETFSEKHRQWCEFLSGKDIHSISNQVYDLTWGAAVWWILINEPRRYAEQLPEGGVAINPAIHNLIDRWFFESQMAAIRRLIDTYPLKKREKDKKDRSAVSLTALLEDVIENAGLLTRENIFRADNLPYEYEEIRRKHDAFITRSGKGGRIPAELNWSASADRHAFLDSLCGVRETNRRPSDTVRVLILISWRECLSDKCKNVKAHVDKYVAHAATPESRAALDTNAREITFKHLQDACHIICKVTSFLKDILEKQATRDFLPLACPFEYLDRPMIESKNLPLLTTAWDDYKRKIDSWGNYRMEEFVSPKQLS
jgi:hypothetical protein